MERYVVYNSTIGYQYFTVDEKSSSEMDKYIQIRSVAEPNIAFVVRKREVRTPTEKEMAEIKSIVARKKEEKKKKEAVPRYTRYTGLDLKNLMRQNRVGYAQLARACGYSSPSTIQSAVFREDRPVTRKLWDRVVEGIQKIRSEEAIIKN